MKLSPEELEYLTELKKKGPLTLEEVMMLYYELPCRRVFPKEGKPPHWYCAAKHDPTYFGRGSVLVKTDDEVVLVCNPLDTRLWNPTKDTTIRRFHEIMPESQVAVYDLGAGTTLVLPDHIIAIVEDDEFDEALRHSSHFMSTRFEHNLISLFVWSMKCSEEVWLAGEEASDNLLNAH